MARKPIMPRIQRRLWQMYYNELRWWWKLRDKLNPPSLNRMITFSGGLGDHLLCSALFRVLREQGERDLWMLTNHPDLFWHNPDIDHVVYSHPYFVQLCQQQGGRFHRVTYTTHISGEKRDMPPTHHLMANMASLLGITGTLELRPWLHLLPEERAFGRFAHNQIAIQSSIASATYPILTKEWYPKRLQSVVDALYPQYTVIQLGMPNDPPLKNVIDARGKLSVRQAASVLTNSRVFIGQVGFLMHLARSVDCRSVIVYGGREHPSQSGYCANVNLYTPLPCAPCWLWDDCPIHRECMQQISSAMVINAVEQQLAVFEEPLAVDRVLIPDMLTVPELEIQRG